MTNVFLSVSNPSFQHRIVVLSNTLCRLHPLSLKKHTHTHKHKHTVDGCDRVISGSRRNYYEALAGRTVAEDAFVWLHKDTRYHAIDLVIMQDDSDTQIIKRFNDRLTKLLDNGVTPFLCLMENGHKGN